MYPRSSSPIDVWLLNQSGVSQAFAQINERVQVPTPPLSECSSSGLGEVGVKSEEVEDKPPPDSSSSGLLSRSIAVPDICKTNNKHVQYQATRTNSFLNKSKSKEAVKSLRPFPTNVSSHVPGPGISRKANFNKSPTANKKSKTYIQSSPVSHTSFVFQDIDPNIINGHKPSSKLSPRRFYNEYPSEKKQISKSAVATPYDKICGGNEIQVKSEYEMSTTSDNVMMEVKPKPYNVSPQIPYCGSEARKDPESLHSLFRLSPPPMDHDYYFSMGQDEGLLELFDITAADFLQ